VAQEAEREGICPVAEKRNLLHRSEEVWRKLLNPLKNTWPEPCHREPDAPGAAHPDEIRPRIPGVASSVVAFCFGKYAYPGRRCSSPTLDRGKGAHEHERDFAVPCL